MSGIVGILNRDGQSVDRELVEAMTGALEFRGSDGDRTWSNGPVAFGHTLFRTTFEANHEIQPHTLDDQVWITADVRIDAREDLARDLGLPQSALARPDCELILHAYACWGESCVDHLLGDFAFAIWDARLRKLFCARDHFGIKPFYYAHLGDTLVFSNTLNCVRLHPSVSDELNELAIADFLVFDYNQDPTTTTFSDIRRLPPAHVLIVTAGGISVRRYWSLPEGERIRYGRTCDYVEHFRSLLEAATGDRLRTDRVGIMMSGGLDSPSVAAFARKARPETTLKAYTVVFDRLIPDDERHYAGLAARALDIPVEFITADHVRPFEQGPNLSTPEPVHDPNRAFLVDYRRRIALDNTVVLTGEGADPLLSLSPLTNWASVREIPIVDAAVNFIRYACECRAIPRIRLRSTLRSLVGWPSRHNFEVPPWLDSAFARRCNVVNRVAAEAGRVRKNEIRPLARKSMRSAYWPWLFEMNDSAWSRVAIEWRHPYFDIRFVRYLLAIPELPYSMDKYLLRLALRDMIPEPVRNRSKTPLRADLLSAQFRQHGIGVTQPIRPHERLSQFIDPTAIPPLPSENSSGRLWVDSKPLSLNNWLSSQQEEPRKWRATTIIRPSEFPIIHRNCISMEMSPH